jgi:hypothetical protein
MKKKSSSKSGFINSRNLIAVLFCTAGISMAMLSFSATASSRKTTPKQKTTTNLERVHGPAAPVRPSAASPTGGTLTSANIGSANALNYADTVGSATNDTFFAGSGTCAVPMSCSTFTLTIDPSVGTLDPTQYQIFIELVWPQAAEDYDTFVCSTGGNCVTANVIASNTSTADPETITLPTTQAPGVYTINAVMATGAFEPYTGTVYIKPIPQTTGCTGNCTPPRYQNYAAGQNQANNAGEPSLGVDWNPNVATLKDTTSKTLTTGNTLLNTGGVAFFTSGPNEWRSNFNDCASPAYNSSARSQSDNPPPAVNNWDDVTATTTQQFVLSDPIGFVDHYSSSELGLAYPEPHTPGRVFTLDLIGGQGDSLGSFSDTDGNSYLPGGNGGPGQGPDHETLGGGPYNLNSVPPPPPQAVAYGSPNAIYYCSQNIVAEAQCSRSDDGGQTFGPGVPIFNPAQCTGGIHGHVKVAPDGTVYVPNSSCGLPSGNSGVAVSTDNGLTWTENNVTGSVNGSQDPSVGIGQNNVGKVGTTNTIYLGYIDGGHAHIADSHDRGATWEHNTDVGAAFGVTHAVFPVVVAGDDNRAAFGFLGTGDGILAPGTTGTCDPYGATLNCANIWHLYIATTYDGGANWITIDATPNDPVQKGTVCLQGTLCAGGRNLLDFNDFAVDAEGRGLVGYADGCVDCSNTFDTQSSANHGTIARQSGGRRLFAHFDPNEPMPPASPQMVSAVTQGTGALVTWLEPDNGGSPITGYNVYRGTTSADPLPFLAHVSGETTTKYFDPSPPAGNVFYYAQATNALPSEGEHCGEVSLSVGMTETECFPPGLKKLTDPAGDTSAVLGIVNTPAPPGSDLLKFQIAQPYQPDGIPRLYFTITTDNGQSPQASGTAWYVAMKIGANYKAVRMAWKAASPTVPIFESYTPGANSSGGVDGRFVIAASEKAAEPTSNYLPPFNQVIIVVKASDLGLNPGDTISGFVSGSELSTNPNDPGVSPGAAGLFDEMPNGLGFTGTYTVDNNQVCKPEPFPVAVLTGSPLTGVAPLTVNFDGSTSSDADGDTIASYTLDFGDGTAPVTQASPMFSHTYNSNGDYPARLTVTDSRGHASLSFSQLVISVTSTLNSAVSRKVHASAGAFDINLPLVGSPRGVECRSGGASNAYTIIYTFARGLSRVDSATVTQGTGTIDTSTSGIGPNGNQYTVNLTGVTNAQYLNVQLDGVHDVAGAIINNAIARVGILIGDVNGNGLVNSTDTSLAQSQSGQQVTSSNFRDDINANALINSTDVSIIQSKSGTGLPSSP